MNNKIINEAFFWRHLSDVLLDKMNIKKEEFYNKITGIKDIWDTDNIKELSIDMHKASEDKIKFIKDSFKEVLDGFEK